MKRHLDLKLFADYHQFYVCEGNDIADTSLLWDEVATDRMLAVAPGLIAVGTVRNIHVPVTIEILDGEPDHDLALWDRVIECPIELTGGTLIAFGCTDNPDGAERLHTTPGAYVARVCYGNLAKISENGLDGDDCYRVQLWSGVIDDVAVVKRRAS